VSGAPLGGVRVLDLTRLLPGPMSRPCTSPTSAPTSSRSRTPAAGDYARTLGDGPDGTISAGVYRCDQSQQARA
jgi:crotonobetainyl-CoA:carnitine CoA-transferase CaiB-like acyl-CoA transferase